VVRAPLVVVHRHRGDGHHVGAHRHDGGVLAADADGPDRAVRHLADDRPDGVPHRLGVLLDDVTVAPGCQRSLGRGHHTAGLNGPDQLVGLNPDLVARNVLAINLEHVAARQLNPARTDTDGLRDVITDAGEGFLMNGLSERSPFLEAIIREGGLRYGVNFVSAASTYGAGDNPDLDAPLLQLIQGSPLYHTPGDTFETISTPGLERVARFVAYFVREVAAAPRSRFHPGPRRPKPQRPREVTNARQLRHSASRLVRRRLRHRSCSIRG